MRVYFLRHGETDWNVLRRLQGSIDTPLNRTGIEQAKRWRRYFDRLPLAGIYSSALDRALHTAHLATGRPACIIEEFNERSFGNWQGRTWAELECTVSELDARWSDNAFCPPGGESRSDLFSRVQSALQQITSRHRSDDEILIVAHGASGHAILAILLGHPIEARGSLPILTNASLSIIELDSSSASLLASVLSEELANSSSL
jgi:probable phosphoglycerate mutase